MTARMAVFFFIMPVLWVALHVYVGRRLIVGSGLPRRGRLIAWAMVAVMGLLPPLTFVAMRAGGPGGATAWSMTQWLGYLVMGLSSIVLVMLLTVDLLRVGRKLVLRLRPAKEQPDPSRRAFLGRAVNLGIVGGAGSVTGVGVVQAQQLPEVVEVEVPIAGLPPEAEGFRIVQISDVHVGPTIHGDFLSAVVDRINELDADVVAVTGDLIDGWVDDLRDEVAALGRIRARHGAFFVTGNHEYYWDGPAWCEEVARLGLHVLNNEHCIIDHDGAQLLLAGVTDISAGGMVPSHASDPAEACAGAPEGCAAKILLAHQPRSIDAAAKAGYDLQISGHTHGGQYFPMNLLVYLAQPYVAGLHRHEDTWIYVSRGTGYWGPPVRVGAPHEITLLRLRRA
ncbi:metallophosphoesterase [Paraliomyxa miuraensis]|uniref:metallophosphoesterase n=1 Tax=Paraliomyxa miuraensis TaxID=376150 RepID=UPI002256A19A|nr:metallophosphoesterase [Paraliomyxa miuraensis]MCX4246975.1 metallophosphoesterase [Paraliomyxa miuraensis]